VTATKAKGERLLVDEWLGRRRYGLVYEGKSGKSPLLATRRKKLRFCSNLASHSENLHV